MKVLLVDVNCKRGSTGKIVYDLFAGLRAAGHEAVIAHGRGPRIREEGIHKISPDFEVYAHALLTRLTGLTSCFSPIATARLIRLIRREKPDVVHLHDIHGYFLNVVQLLKHLKKQRVRTVMTLHCEYMYTGKCGYAYACERYKAECGQCPEKKSYPTSLFFDCTRFMLRAKKRVYSGWDDLTVVSVSEWLGNRVKGSTLADKKQAVIHNGIDTGVFAPTAVPGLRERMGDVGKKLILHVTGDFSDERKGGRYVLELARRMPDVHFTIVGNRDAVDNLPPNVHALGRTENQEELAGCYSAADAMLITSKMENFPTVCVESVCCGTPVIGFDMGGIAETAPDGYGLFVPFGDMDALETAARKALSGALADRETCAGFGKARYSADVMAANYLALYREMVRG